MAEIALNNLLKYWEEQGIFSKENSSKKIEQVEKKLRINLPEDFKVFYRACNGMESLYPNNTDSNGFLFYPVEHLIHFEEERNLGERLIQNGKGTDCLIFMNYLQKSWWYGLLLNGNKYSIAIISGNNNFRIISHSLKDFISLYILDSEILYDY